MRSLPVVVWIILTWALVSAWFVTVAYDPERITPHAMVATLKEVGTCRGTASD